VALVWQFSVSILLGGWLAGRPAVGSHAGSVDTNTSATRGGLGGHGGPGGAATISSGYSGLFVDIIRGTWPFRFGWWWCFLNIFKNSLAINWGKDRPPRDLRLFPANLGGRGACFLGQNLAAPLLPTVHVVDLKEGWGNWRWLSRRRFTLGLIEACASSRGSEQVYAGRVETVDGRSGVKDSTPPHGGF